MLILNFPIESATFTAKVGRNILFAMKDSIDYRFFFLEKMKISYQNPSFEDFRFCFLDFDDQKTKISEKEKLDLNRS